MSNNVDYGKNRALLAWYYIDRMFTQKNSSLCPAYIKNDKEQLSSPYVREVTTREIWPNRELNYGEQGRQSRRSTCRFIRQSVVRITLTIQISMPISIFSTRRSVGAGIMRKLDNTNFETSNIEYIQFWMMDPFSS